MPQINDVVKYHYGKNDTSFFGNELYNDALVVEVLSDDELNLIVINKAGNPTIPVSNVLHKKTKGRDKNSAFWS